MNSNTHGITKLQMNETVSLLVIIGGVSEGIAQGSTQLQNMIATYVEVNDVDDFNEDWILDNVETFPLLSTEPLQLTYDVKQELDITFDEGYEVVTYYIDDIDTEFDTLQELEDWITDSINDHDYTAEQCKSWDIEKRIKVRMDLEVEGDDEFDITAYGARRTVSQFIEVPEPTPPTDDTADIEVAKGHPGTIERGMKIWALSEYYANARLKADKPVYLFDDEGRGVRTESIQEIRQHIDNGGMVGRLWNIADNEY